MTKSNVRKTVPPPSSHPLISPVSKADSLSGRTTGAGRNPVAVDGTRRIKGHCGRAAAHEPAGSQAGSRSHSGIKTLAKREKLLGEIESMLDVLTEDGLSHVLAVATMCRYELALVRSEAAREADSLPSLEGEELRMERSADGSTYHLISGKVWKILAAEDIASLLRISRHVDDEASARREVYQWMKAERKDIAHDFGIRGESSPVLEDLLCLLAETFPVRSPRRLP